MRHTTLCYQPVVSKQEGTTTARSRCSSEESKLADLWIQHILVVVDDHIGKGEHVAGQEVGAPTLLPPIDSQVLQSVDTGL